MHEENLAEMCPPYRWDEERVSVASYHLSDVAKRESGAQQWSAACDTILNIGWEILFSSALPSNVTAKTYPSSQNNFLSLTVSQHFPYYSFAYGRAGQGQSILHELG